MRVAGVAALVLLLTVPVLVNAIDPFTDGTADLRTSEAPPDSEALEDVASAHYSELEPIARIDPGDTRDITLRGDYAYAAGHSGLRIYNISDPANPVRVGYYDCPSRDLALQGDTLAVVREGWGSCGFGSGGVAVFDVSTPSNPIYRGAFSVLAHTITAQPGTDLIHIASSDLYRDATVSPGKQDILEATAGGSARLTTPFYFPLFAESGQPINAPSCHEITFNADGTRGYCAGIVETHIWDTSDPTDIKVLTVITNPSISIHHGAFVDATGDLLVLNDEFLGVLTSAADACLPVTDKSSYGALWFYDISNEQVPVPLSWIQVPSTAALPHYCTSHFGNILPNNEQLVWGWYSAGPVLVDFSNVLLPRIEDSFVVSNAHTWGAYYHEGYVFSGDTNRGFEVFELS